MSHPETPDPPRKPRDDEIDVYGLTHAGLARKSNQDHFLLAAIHKNVQVLQTSLSERDRLPLGSERLAFLGMVADGVGSGEGETASRTTLEIAMQYVVGSMAVYYGGGDSSEASFVNALQDAAQRCHEAVARRKEQDPRVRSMATTLTLYMGVWPWIHVLQVGDSRYYLYREGTLTQVSRDQTLAQDLVDNGVFTRAMGEQSRFAHVLSSSIGGEQTAPVVTRLRSDWHNVHLLCSDGLTKHVPDARIAERLAAMSSARQVCEQLLQDALDGGGSDNVTIIVGRAVPKPGPASA
jgi:serine/threonine protein phosphatase PrpC